MARFVLSRAAQAIILLLIMSFVIYALLGLMPGDPMDAALASNPDLSPAAIAHLRQIYGLDQPLLSRYWHWLTAALTGDFGYSRLHQQPVLAVLGPALLQTARLMLLSFALSVVAALTLGLASSLKPGGAADTAINLFAFAGISVPVFWLALMMILVFAAELRWLPASGIGISAEPTLVDQARHLAMPVVTLALVNTGAFIRYVRAAMIETMRLDFIRTARAKGASEWRVVLVHAFRNALIPVVTVMALSFGSLFSGALVTETMFAQPGMGKTIYDAILGNDYNLALVGLLFATVLTMIGNLSADLLYALLDPRIRLD